MRADEFQVKAMETAVYPEWARVVYPVLGLTGEAAELAEKVRDAIFPDGQPAVAGDGEGGDLARLWEVLTGCVVQGRWAELLKKHYRDNRVPEAFARTVRGRVQAGMAALQSDAVKREIGDASWYSAAVCRDLGLMLSEVLEANVAKLAARKAADTLRGSGDDR